MIHKRHSRDDGETRDILDRVPALRPYRSVDSESGTLARFSVSIIREKLSILALQVCSVCRTITFVDQKEFAAKGGRARWRNVSKAKRKAFAKNIGSKGGKRRAEKMTPKQRSAQARRAVNERWRKYREEKGEA